MTNHHTQIARMEPRALPLSALKIGISIILVIQAWLLVAAVGDRLTAGSPMAWSSFGASLLCLFVNAGLLRYLCGGGGKA